MHRSRDRDGGRAQQQAADQVDACAGAIDEEADRRLQYRRDQVEGGERETELGIGHAEVRAYERKQRREYQDVIVADQMGEAHARDELGLARAGGGAEFGSLGHCCFWSCRADQAACAARASSMARQTRYGVAGMSRWRIPNSASAWAIAFMIEVSEPAQPASPQPLTPS